MWELTEIVTKAGYIGIILAIFAESGLFFGFFFPGDSLLFSAGLLSAAGHFNIWILAIGCFVAAVAGDSFGYWFGSHMGPRIFRKEDSHFFHKSHLEKTAKFYEKYGRKTVLLARIIPIVRTFGPIFAGVARMPYKIFFMYNVVGAFIWTFGFLFIAYFLGTTIPAISQYLEWIVLGIIATSFLPIIHEYWRERGKTEI